MPRIIILLISLFIATFANAKKTPSPCDDLTPEIDITAATEIAKNYMLPYKIKGINLYIKKAELKCENDTLNWHMDFILGKESTGFISIIVTMQGAAKSGHGAIY